MSQAALEKSNLVISKAGVQHPILALPHQPCPLAVPCGAQSGPHASTYTKWEPRVRLGTLSLPPPNIWSIPESYQFYLVNLSLVFPLVHTFIATSQATIISC